MSSEPTTSDDANPPMLPPKLGEAATGQESMLSSGITPEVPAQAEPWLEPERARWAPALALCWAGRWLPQEPLEELARSAPKSALRCVSDRLPAELLTELARREPLAALRFAAHRLSDELRQTLQASRLGPALLI